MFKNQWGGPGLHDLMKELRTVLDEYDGDRMLVGEDDNIDYMGNGNDELHLVFNFPLMRTEKLTPAHIRKNQKERTGPPRQTPHPRMGLQHPRQPRLLTHLHLLRRWPARRRTCPRQRRPGADPARHALLL
jgi:hypothetical protein